jgi:nucleoside-diphosphate-sugar epimerase
MPKILIAGASGVVGAAALEQFLGRGWEAVALSRRRPEIDSASDYRHLAVDLRDADASRRALGELEGVTHVLYAALYEKPGLVAGWYEQDQMQINLQMLRNCLEPLLGHGQLQQVTILQGTKAYGVHLHAIPIPARERAPRDDHANFYWLQEDYLREQSANHDFGWSALRPQMIIGGAIGVAMNLVPVLGVYAAICREKELPFGFPGGVSAVFEASDARLVAAAAEFTATDPRAAGQHYNVTNGDVFEWRNLWPSIADQLGLEPGPDEPRSMANFLPENADAWDKAVRDNGLRPTRLPDILGESHYYADLLFASGATEPLPPAFVSAIKLRQAGVCEFYDTEETFRYWIRWLQDRNVLPRAGSLPAA